MQLLAIASLLSSLALVNCQFSQLFNLALNIARDAGADKNALNQASQIGGKIAQGTDKIMHGDIAGGLSTAASASGSAAASQAVNVLFKSIPGLSQAIEQADRDIKGNQGLSQANNIMASIGNTANIFETGIVGAINHDEQKAIGGFLGGGASILSLLVPDAFNQAPEEYPNDYPPAAGGSAGAAAGGDGAGAGGDGAGGDGDEAAPAADNTPKFSLDDYKKLSKDEKWDLIVSAPETIFKLGADQLEIDLATAMLVSDELINNWDKYSTDNNVLALFWAKFPDAQGITTQANARFNKVNPKACTAWKSKYTQLKPTVLKALRDNKVNQPPLSTFAKKTLEIFMKYGLYSRDQ